MTHLDEVRLLELRDGAGHGPDAASAAHLAACAACRGALDALRARAASVAAALATLDAPWDLDEARARVRERVSAARAGATGALPLTRRTRRAAWGGSRAAGLLLVTAAAASALPGSPVRAWLFDLLGPRAEEAPVEPAAGGAAAGAPATTAETTGIRLAVARGPVRVVLRGAAPGAEIRVTWVPGVEAAVFAPVGSRFTSAEGRIEAQVAPGPVRVELPLGVTPATLEVDGRGFVRRTDAGLEVTGPTVERSDAGILFRVPGR